MKIFKKTLAVLLSMAIMLAFLPTPTFADNVEENYNTIRTNVVDEFQYCWNENFCILYCNG